MSRSGCHSERSEESLFALPHGKREIDKWENLAEKKIREAMEQGKFANLDGAGEPLDLEENPLEPPELAPVRRLLRNNGFSLPWVEDRKELQRELQSLHAELAHQVERESNTSWLRPLRGKRLEHLSELFGARIAELNRRIARFNLKAPSPNFHLRAFDLAREVGKLFSANQPPNQAR